MAFFEKKNHNHKIDPDEIFLDSENISGFDANQFEGRLEKPIRKKTFIFLSVFFGIIGVFFFFRLFSLQIVNGGKFKERSVKNTIKKEKIIPLRGIINDKNKITLVENGENNRVYANLLGLSHVLGYTSLPSKEDLEKTPGLISDEMIGKDGIEKKYDQILRGTAGIKFTERDSQGQIISESRQVMPKNGQELTLTIDSKIQSHLFESIKAVITDHDYKGGSAIILDVNDGSVLAMTNVPEYSSQTLSQGWPPEEISGYINNKNKPFLNRAISGLYAPGSVVKPLVALAALNERTISPSKQILSAGSISIPNPFFPDKKTIFKDWKEHGWVDMRRAIAVSSDVYFYEVGGGFEGVKGLGINKIYEYAKKFELGGKTGIDLPGELKGTIPNSVVKREKNPSDPIWRVGDTYISSIGQGYFLSTPIEIAVYVAAIANNGKIVNPHLLMSENESPNEQRRIDIPEEYFEIVKEGMRMAVTEGTVQSLNYLDFKIAAKTGTAEVGKNKSLVNSWLVGFFPYKNPKYAFVAVLEKGSIDSSIGAPYAMKQFFDWLKLYYSEYTS